MNGSRITDLLVIGGGPAGLAVAIRARQHHLTVRVVERRAPPVDKACGEGLMPDGVARLEALGVGLPVDQATPLRGIRYIDGDAVAEGRFPGPPGAGVRRVTLHRAMAGRAAEAGADLAWRTEVRGLLPDGVATSSGPFAARWIIAADGLRSTIRQAIGLAGPPPAFRRYGVTRHFDLPPWTDCVEVHWADTAEAYVTPMGRHEVGVAILWSGRNLPFAARLEQFPVLASRLDGRPAIGPSQGAGPLAQRAAAVVQGNIALVGDASGYIDALTGEGLSLAFHQAFAVIDAIRRGDLEIYARAWPQIVRRASAATRLLLFVERRPALRARMVDALAADPALFSRMLGVHARQLPFRALAGWASLRGVYRMVKGIQG